MGQSSTSIFTKLVDPIGLAVFRTAYAVVLLCEVIQLFYFKDLVYPQAPVGVYADFNPTLVFIFWIPTLLLLAIGLWTRVACLVNYIFSVVLFSSATNFEYHIFYSYVAVAFLLMFIPVGRVLSIDALLVKLRMLRNSRSAPRRISVPVINYYAPVLIGVGFVYIDSIFFKLTSPMWMGGLGMWVPSSLPFMTWTDTTFLLNHEMLVKAMGVTVVVFEALFPFVFWFRSWRVSCLLVGGALHLGILIAYPIPWFALAVLCLYLLLVPIHWWRAFLSMVRVSSPRYTVHYCATSALGQLGALVVSHFDVCRAIRIEPVRSLQSSDGSEVCIAGLDKVGAPSFGFDNFINVMRAFGYTFPLGVLFAVPPVRWVGRIGWSYIVKVASILVVNAHNVRPVERQPSHSNSARDELCRAIARKGWIIGLVLMCLIQGVISYQSPMWREVTIRTGVSDTRFHSLMSSMYGKIRWPAVALFGLCSHPVFMDEHFDSYNHMIKFEYHDEGGERIVAPVYGEGGLVDVRLTGPLFVNYTFRVVGSYLQREKYEQGVTQYLDFYHRKYQEKAAGGYFVFSVKPLRSPTGWEKDFLKHQREAEWRVAGFARRGDKGWNFSWEESMLDIFNSESEK